MNRSKLAALTAVAWGLALLASCTPTPPAQPVANAGDSRAVVTGEIVLLDGSRSTSATNLPLTWLWTLSTAPKGSQARLTGTDVTNPSFVADVSGVYKVTLIVAHKDAQSAPVTIDITATATDPVAYVYSQTGAPGTVIILDGSASKAPNGNVITYQWTVTDPALAPVTLVSPTSSRPSFRADLVGVYAVSLVVNDGSRDSAPMTATVTISYLPQPPIASAGPSLTVARGVVVNLNGQGSFDPDQTALTYAWAMFGKPTGSTATLVGVDTATPTFIPDLVGTYQLSLTVTDASGARSAPSWATITCVNNAPTAVFTAPADVFENNPTTLNATGSTDPDGDRLRFDWFVFSAPVGGSGGFSNQTPEGKIDFIANKAGAYLVVLTVTDAQGNEASATRTLTVTRTSSFSKIVGDAQTETVNVAYAIPMSVEARIGSTPVPNAQLGWRIQNASLISSMPRTDASGRAVAFVRAGRFSGTGRLTVWLLADPSVTETFTFTMTPGPVTLVTIGAPVVDATANGVLVQVRTTDQYGNLARNPASDTLPIQLIINGGQVTTVFDSVVANSKGTLTSGGTTNLVKGELVAGEFEILVKETKPGGFTITVVPVPGSSTSFPLPFARWYNSQLEDAEFGNLNGWTPTASGSRPWAVKKGIQAGGRRSFGLERLPGEQLLTNSYASLSKALLTTSATVKLTMKHQLLNPSAPNTVGKCSAHASAQLWLKNCTALNCGVQQLVPPTDGYDYFDSCDGQPGFASTNGFVTKTFDLSDAVAAGASIVNFALQNNMNVSAPNPATPNGAVNWYVDDVQAFTLIGPSTAGALIETGILAGPLAAYAWTQSGAWGNVVYGSCAMGISPSLTAMLRAEDSRGNLARGVDEVLHFNLGSGATFTGAPAGTIVGTPGLQNVDMQFANSLVSLSVSTAGVAAVVPLTLTDLLSQGLALPAPASLTFQTLICHVNGLGGAWSDTVSTGTFTQSQATRACESYAGLNSCVAGSDRVISPLINPFCAEGRQWIFTATTQTVVCGGSLALAAGNVTRAFYTSLCGDCSSVIPPTPSAVGQFNVQGNWN